jgi:hypothetical protein
VNNLEIEGGAMNNKFRTIFIVQIIVASVALILTIGAAWAIPSLYEMKRSLTKDVESLRDEKLSLVKEKEDLTKKNEELRTLGADALNNSVDGSKEKPEDVNKSKERVDRVVNANPSAAALIPRVYIQIQVDSQRPRANKIVEFLKARHYVVYGIETRPVKISTTLIKYFFDSDKDAAKSLADLLRQQGVTDATPQYTQGYEGSVKPGQFEIWFSLDSLNNIQRSSAKE